MSWHRAMASASTVMTRFDARMNTGPALEVLKRGHLKCWLSELILRLRPANERRRYTVTPSLIGSVQT